MRAIETSVPNLGRFNPESVSNVFRVARAHFALTTNWNQYLEPGVIKGRQEKEKQLVKVIAWANPKDSKYIDLALDISQLPPGVYTEGDMAAFGWKNFNEALKTMTAESLERMGESASYLSRVMSAGSEWNPEKEIIPHLVRMAFISSMEDREKSAMLLKIEKKALRQTKLSVGLTKIPSNCPRVKNLNSLAEHVGNVMQMYISKSTTPTSLEFAAHTDEYDFRHGNLQGRHQPILEGALISNGQIKRVLNLEEVVTQGRWTRNNLYEPEKYDRDLVLAPSLDVMREDVNQVDKSLSDDMRKMWLESIREGLSSLKDDTNEFGKKSQVFCQAAIERIGMIIQYGPVAKDSAYIPKFSLSNVESILEVFDPDNRIVTVGTINLTDEQKKESLMRIGLVFEMLAKRAQLVSEKVEENQQNHEDRSEMLRAIAIMAFSHLKAIK